MKTMNSYLPPHRKTNYNISNGGVTGFSGVTPARFCWCLCLLVWIFGKSTPANHKIRTSKTEKHQQNNNPKGTSGKITLMKPQLL
jgi:hypothetical protein